MFSNVDLKQTTHKHQINCLLFCKVLRNFFTLLVKLVRETVIEDCEPTNITAELNVEQSTVNVQGHTLSLSEGYHIWTAPDSNCTFYIHAYGKGLNQYLVAISILTIS